MGKSTGNAKTYIKPGRDRLAGNADLVVLCDPALIDSRPACANASAKGSCKLIQLTESFPASDSAAAGYDDLRVLDIGLCQLIIRREAKKLCEQYAGGNLDRFLDRFAASAG